MRVKDRLQDLQQRLLDQPIQHRRNAQHPLAASRLRDHHPAHGMRPIAATEQLLSNARPVRLAVRHQVVDGHSVHARRTAVAHHPLIRRHQVPAAHHLVHEAQRPVPGGSHPCRTRLTRSARTLGGSAACSPGPLRHLSRFVCICTCHRTDRSGSVLTVRPFTASAATMASADFCGPIPAPLRAGSPPAAPQISRGKTRDLRSTYLPHLRTVGPGDVGLRIFVPPRPPRARLLCGSCSSGQSFACSFLPTPPRGRCSCCSARGYRHLLPQRTCTSKSLPGSLSLTG
jgi:hypothetical protein